MNNEILKIYELPNPIKKVNLDDNSMNFNFSYNIGFEEIISKFSEQEEEATINYLYEKYKNTDVSKIYVLSKPEFEDFLFTMLPKYIEIKG